jgi:hypothetical protein
MQTRLYVLLATGVVVLTVAFSACYCQLRPGSHFPPVKLVPPGEVDPNPGRLEHNRKKRAAVAELLARQLTLPEAAALFREIDRQPPKDSTRAGEVTFPGLSEAERYCRLVISYAEVVLEEQSPQRKAGEVARLEAELNALRDRDGEIRLPDPDTVRARTVQGSNERNQ